MGNRIYNSICITLGLLLLLLAIYTIGLFMEPLSCSVKAKVEELEKGCNKDADS